MNRPRWWSEAVKPGRTYRVSDPGDRDRLARVEFSDDGGSTWRETPNGNRRSIEHYRLHGKMPPGFDSWTWERVKPLFDAFIKAERASQ